MRKALGSVENRGRTDGVAGEAAGGISNGMVCGG